jgi:Uma2 family endonuclease
MTADDLLRMPDDGFRYELIRGELRKMPPAGQRHGRIAINISTPLNQFVRAHAIGTVYAAETGFRLASDPDTVRAPDVAFVSRDRVEPVGDIAGYWPGAPDLAVEVVSPGESYMDVQDKVLEWLNAGTRMVVTVDPGRRITMVYRSPNEISLLGAAPTRRLLPQGTSSTQ